MSIEQRPYEWDKTVTEFVTEFVDNSDIYVWQARDLYDKRMAKTLESLMHRKGIFTCKDRVSVKAETWIEARDLKGNLPDRGLVQRLMQSIDFGRVTTDDKEALRVQPQFNGQIQRGQDGHIGIRLSFMVSSVSRCDASYLYF